MTDLSPEPLAGAPTPGDPRALWTGGVAAGVVAWLVAVAGIVIARGVLHIPLLAPQQHGTWGSANTPTYAACAFAATLIATGLIHPLLLFVPQPFVFFGRILGVATVVAAAEPFTSDASLSAKLATAAINLVLGGRVVARGWDREPFTAGTPFTDRKAAGCRGSLVPFGRLSRRTCLSRWLFVLLLDFSGSRCSLENVCRVRVVRQNDWVLGRGIVRINRFQLLEAICLGYLEADVGHVVTMHHPWHLRRTTCSAARSDTEMINDGRRTILRPALLRRAGEVDLAGQTALHATGLPRRGPGSPT
ncbi:MAG: hypothetical protein QOE97_1717 [Pseudonocardiales bacterium]|nr:hypothetical protein [Pseudonocardiales bacterium]